MFMNIGFISTWFERGAAYVTKSYIEALQDKNNIFVYARGGESFAKDDSDWNKDYVTWGKRLSGTNINKIHLYEWIKKNEINVVFFNEQHEFSIVASLKRDFRNLKIGSYIDYYKENTIEFFDIYDFIICNTKRHYEAFENHKQKYFVPWGTNTNIFKPNYQLAKKSNELVFFHSAGMSNRKGTDLVIKAFIKGELFNRSKLIIHTQVDIKGISGYETNDLLKYNIQVIKKTVTAPGLYYLGDVYVYPTKLEGLGLTIFEALASGLPVITTDNAPMNEVVTNDVGKLIEVERLYSRSDGYYWPLSVCSISDLINKMSYYIENYSNLDEFKVRARKYAEEKLDWKDQTERVNDIFNETIIKDFNKELYVKIIKKEKDEKIVHLKLGLNTNNIFGELAKQIFDIKRSK